MTDLFSLVKALAAGYVLNGWPFLLAHIFVAILIRNSWTELSRERKALEKWNVPKASKTDADDKEGLSSPPTESVPAANRSEPFSLQIDSTTAEEKKPQTIAVLEQFVEESRVLGPKGVFVPMTDFSDRLDSAVEGKIAELHDRTNLFLYVGIAGTMFGVFEFAFKSYNVIISGGLAQGEKVIKLGEYLSGSMSKAFPVGFFGLVFTFVSQVIATRPEQRLREELSEAARKALEARQAATHSQAELLQQAAATVATAMQPLKDLKDTLSESLKPVVEVFGERLDKSLKLLEAQFKRLEQTSSGLQSAVDDVREAVGSVAAATKSLESLIKETPKVISRLLDLEKKHESSLDKVDVLFTSHFEHADKLSNALQLAVENLYSLSQRVIDESSEGIKRIEEASISGWTTSAETLRKKLETDLASLFNEAGTRMAELTLGVENALRVMDSVGSLSAGSIAAIGKIAPEIAEDYKQSLTKVGTDSVALWEEMINKLGKNSQDVYQAFIDEVRKGTSKSSDALKSAATSWHHLAQNSEQVLKEPVQAAVAEARKDLVDSLRSLDANLADRIKQFSDELKELQESTSQLVGKVSSINTSLSDWAIAAGPLAKEIKAGLRGMKEQSESQASIVKRLDNTTEKLAKIADRSNRPKNGAKGSDGGGEPTVIRPIEPGVVWWKPSTWSKR